MPRNHTGLHRGDTARTSVAALQRVVVGAAAHRNRRWGGARRAVAGGSATITILRDDSDGLWRGALAAALYGGGGTPVLQYSTVLSSRGRVRYDTRWRVPVGGRKRSYGGTVCYRPVQ